MGKHLADGITELVERSLRGARGKTDLRPAVLAALPHVEPLPFARGSNMWKLAIAASVAKLAAEASLAADAQGKFWELHDAMIAQQDDLSRDAIVAYAKDAGLDAKAIADALDKHTFADDLAKEVGAATEIGVRATPEFLINGEDFRGARPIEAFRTAIDAALAATH